MSHVTLIGGKISNWFGFQGLFLKHGFNEAGFDSEFNLFASNHICPSFWHKKSDYWQRVSTKYLVAILWKLSGRIYDGEQEWTMMNRIFF